MLWWSSFLSSVPLLIPPFLPSFLLSSFCFFLLIHSPSLSCHLFSLFLSHRSPTLLFSSSGPNIFSSSICPLVLLFFLLSNFIPYYIFSKFILSSPYFLYIQSPLVTSLYTAVTRFFPTWSPIDFHSLVYYIKTLLLPFICFFLIDLFCLWLLPLYCYYFPSSSSLSSMLCLLLPLLSLPLSIVVLTPPPSWPSSLR